MRLLVLVAVLGSAAFGCATASDPSTGSGADDLLSTSGSTDVQVISVKTGRTIDWSLGNTRYDATKCAFSNKKPSSGGGGFNVNAQADCTDSLIAGAKLPSINKYVEPDASLREIGSTLSNVSMRHWCSSLEVVVAVKASAWNDPTFEGIGFYGYEPTIDEKDADRRVFYSKADPRLVRDGEGALKNEGGQKVYLYRFTGAGPCEVNGTGRNPSSAIEFKPYAGFSGGDERWESVSDNHRLRYQAKWDRSSDLLQ